MPEIILSCVLSQSLRNCYGRNKILCQGCKSLPKVNSNREPCTRVLESLGAITGRGCVRTNIWQTYCRGFLLLGLDFVAHSGCQNWTRCRVCGFCVRFLNAVPDVKILQQNTGSIVTLPCGLTPVLDLTSGALLGYPLLPPQISNLCIKKMSIKIIPSKKYPHNKTKSSISFCVSACWLNPQFRQYIPKIIIK